MGMLGSLDYLKHPVAECSNPFDELASISAVRPYQTKAWEASKQLHADEFGAISILDACAVHHNRQQETQSVYGDVSLASFDLLASIEAIVPPFWGVFADWLSIMAAEGVFSLPWLTLTRSRRAS